MPRFSLRLPLLIAPLLIVSRCFAYGSFSPTNLAALTDSAVNSLIETAAIGSTYHPMQSATPLGLIFGLEVGVDVVLVSLPSDFQNALATASNEGTSSVPAVVPLPRVDVHKGLPFNIDVGFAAASYQSVFALYGGDVKWAFLPNKAFGSLALRQTVNYSKLYFLSSHSYDSQLLYSKKLIGVDPYFGTGVLFWNGDLGGSGLPTQISAYRSGTSPHIFVGLPIDLLGLRVAAEYDYNFSGVTTYGARVGLGF